MFHCTCQLILLQVLQLMVVYANQCADSWMLNGILSRFVVRREINSLFFFLQNGSKLIMSNSKCVIKIKPHLLLHIFYDTPLGDRGVVVSMLGASWSIMENMQHTCGVALWYHIWVKNVISYEIVNSNSWFVSWNGDQDKNDRLMQTTILFNLCMEIAAFWM